MGDSVMNQNGGALQVHFISAVCENMISGKGMRPGDIVTAMNGITIEVNNTDAEGRLTLADSLVYACRLRVDAVCPIFSESVSHCLGCRIFSKNIYPPLLLGLTL
jgi:leucyl aminopeptidase